MKTIRDQALDAIYALFPLAASHCENLLHPLKALKENVNLVNGTSLLLILGDTRALAKFAAVHFPSVFGNGCYKFNASVVYHLVPGEKTQLVDERDSEQFKSRKIKTQDFTKRVVMIADLDRLSQLVEILRYVDRILIVKSSEPTENDLEKLLALDDINTNVGLTYVGPNYEKVKETFSGEADFFDDPSEDILEAHLTKRCEEARDINLYVAICSCIKIADSICVRIDEKRVFAEKAAAHELEGTYAEKNSAFECLQSGIASKKADIRNEIMDAAEDAQLELSLDFSAAKRDGVHQKATQVVKDLNFKRPKDFRKNAESINERINETMLIESTRRISIREAQIIDKATEAYTRATNAVEEDLVISGFAQQIQPVSSPLEIEYVTAKNTVYKKVADMTVDVTLDQMPRANRFYRRGLPISIGGGFGYSGGKFFTNEEDKAEIIASFFGGEKTTLTFFHEVSLPDVVAKATTAGVEKHVTAGISAKLAGGAGSAAKLAGGAGIAAKFVGGAAVTVATGGMALPIMIVCVGTGMLGGNWVGKNIQRSAELDAYKNAYEKAITMSLNSISAVVKSIVSKAKKKVLREAESTFDSYKNAVIHSAEQEVELYKEVEDAPALKVALQNDKTLLKKTITELSKIEQELVTSEFQQ